MPTPFDSESLDNLLANACRPIPAERRDAFVHAVTQALANGGELVGPGTMFRVVRSLQSQYFHAPNLNGASDDEPPHPRRIIGAKYR